MFYYLLALSVLICIASPKILLNHSFDEGIITDTKCTKKTYNYHDTINLITKNLDQNTSIYKRL